MPDKKKKPNVHDLLNQLEAKEDAFLQQAFLAPALRGGSVQVRIAGAVCNMKIEPARFQGWGVFQPESHTSANLLREASSSERREYLKLFANSLDRLSTNWPHLVCVSGQFWRFASPHGRHRIGRPEDQSHSNSGRLYRSGTGRIALEIPESFNRGKTTDESKFGKRVLWL